MALPPCSLHGPVGLSLYPFGDAGRVTLREDEPVRHSKAAAKHSAAKYPSDANMLGSQPDRQSAWVGSAQFLVGNGDMIFLRVNAATHVPGIGTFAAFEPREWGNPSTGTQANAASGILAEHPAPQVGSRLKRFRPLAF